MNNGIYFLLCFIFYHGCCFSLFLIDCFMSLVERGCFYKLRSHFSYLNLFYMVIIPSNSLSKLQMTNTHKLMLEDCFEMIKSRLVNLMISILCSPELYKKRWGAEEIFYSLYITWRELLTFKIVPLISFSLAFSDSFAILLLASTMLEHKIHVDIMYNHGV